MKWINVKDAMPKDGQTVAVLTGFDKPEMIPPHAMRIASHCCRKGWVIDYRQTYLEEVVRFWCPLPDYNSRMDNDIEESERKTGFKLSKDKDENDIVKCTFSGYTTPLRYEYLNDDGSVETYNFQSGCTYWVPRKIIARINNKLAEYFNKDYTRLYSRYTLTECKD
jgi:hypothetical protein